MNNDLEFVRELRPPAADPTTAVVEQEREHLMSFIQKSRTTRTGRRTASIAGAVGVSIIALGGVAAAAGLIPDAITDRFAYLEQRDGEIKIDDERAIMVASDIDGTNEVQLWVAPILGADRECVYVRSSWQQANGEGVAEDGPVGCEDHLRPWVDPDFTLTGPPDYLASLDVYGIGSSDDGYGATGLSGAAHPDVAALVVELRDGRQLTVDSQSPEGWFAAIVAGDLTATDAIGLPSNPAVHVTLLDGSGRVLAELDDWSRFRAQPTPNPESD